MDAYTRNQYPVCPFACSFTPLLIDTFTLRTRETLLYILNQYRFLSIELQQFVLQNFSSFRAMDTRKLEIYCFLTERCQIVCLAGFVEVISLCVNDDNGGEILHHQFPDGFSTQVFVGNHLGGLDAAA